MLRNDFKDFEVKFSSEDNPNIKTEDFIWYYLNDKESNKGIVALGIGKGNTLVQDYNSDIQELSGNDNRIKSKDRTKLFKEKNITNDIELINYLVETANTKNNIFDSVKDMRDNYTIHSLIRNVYSNVEGITLIAGDYEGYCFNYNFDTSHIVECNILKDGKRYGLTFNNSNYFTAEYINELLNTLIISDENLSKDQIIKINNELYYNTNEESTVEGRCGNMDGYITSSVSDDSIPSVNNQSNFGTGYGYQYIEDNIEVRIDGKFIVFKKR